MSFHALLNDFLFTPKYCRIAMCILMALSQLVSSDSESEEMDREPYKELDKVLQDYESSVAKPNAVKEHFYFPYWDKGHWVFDRMKLKSTERPLGHFLQKGKWAKHYECNQICLGIYEAHGEICAQRFVTRASKWKYEYKKFRNMCYLEYENCKHVYKHWYPIHEGGCPEFKRMTQNPTSAWRVANRVQKWQRRIKSNKITVGQQMY
ncbi:unnamed protein product [Leptosia nina]|uniref:Uncharacterized protein n=1 Tax=Leptosia nina TaxID=320188 RepID=A0AAV1JCZ5_9NEOP